MPEPIRHRIQCGCDYRKRSINGWIVFVLDGWIRSHVAAVVGNLPADVKSDLMNDPGFMMCDYNPGPHVMMHVPMRLVGRGKPGRSIVLKHTLKLPGRRPFMPAAGWWRMNSLHAYLRHGGRSPGERPGGCGGFSGRGLGISQAFGLVIAYCDSSGRMAKPRPVARISIPKIALISDEVMLT